jgi:hypothetical protein
MKLGKALATGVAEERPETHEEETDLQVVEVVEAADELRAPAAEEVTVAR